MKTTTLFHTEGNRAVCEVCPRRCRLEESRRGFCYVRQNLGGEIVSTTYGKSTGFCIDPIEKKPLNQFYPGTPVLSFGTAGCNLGCRFCQNWTSTKSTEVEAYCESASPEQIATAAYELGCKSVAYTYNDPIIWLEYARDTARACRERGIKNVAVTAGYITPEARGEFFEFMDAANVDLKAFTDDFYRRLCQIRLEPVLDTIRWLVQETEVWVELTNLIIPGENDSPDELKRMCGWIVEELGPDVPLHFSAFHPDFELNSHPATPLRTLLTARDIAKEAGIHYTYTGNVHDPSTQATYCPACEAMLIERNGYTIGDYRLKFDDVANDPSVKSARCQKCDAQIAGRYDSVPGDWGSKRQPVRIADFQVSPNLSPSHVAEKDRKTGETMSTSDQAKKQPTLTTEQESLIYQAAGARVAATVNPRSYLAPTKLPNELSEISVLGSFVSLKRSGQLRSCCGYMADAIPLGNAVDHAAIRAAKDDPRFPPISANEMEHLDMEVWILWNLEEMTATGAERIDAFEIGKHGLIVEQGHARGLLLPSVATEHGFDNEEFLRQTCRKAGLPLEAWTDPKTKVQTFEGHVIQGKLASTLKASRGGDSSLESQEALPKGHGPIDSDVVRLAQFCHANLVANLSGATPNPYATGGYDGSVNGILLSVDAPGLEETLELARIAIKPPIPLQTTLFPLIQTAAASLRGAGLSQIDPGKIEVGLTVVWDPIMHGPSESPDLAGIDPVERAIIVMGPSGWSWAYDPEATVDELLVSAIQNAHLPKKSTGQVISCLVASTEDRVASSNVPKSNAARPPAVAGTFYPRTAEEVDQMLDKLFADIKTSPEPWPGVMVPHAGWIYSGHLAAETLSRVQIPKTVLILAPKHGPNGADWAVLPNPAWRLPGREVMSDLDLVEKLVDTIDHLEADTGAHRSEHSIEVQLPIIARLAPEARVVGIAMHGGEWKDYAQFSKQLAALIETLDEPPLLVASSDMNHFADEKTTRQVDRIALDAIESLDPQRLFETVRDNRISMCGVVPTAIIMETLRHLGKLERTELVGYETSAKASGDTNRVVGYAGVVFG